MKAVSIGLLFIGALFLVVAVLGVSTAPNVSYLIGTFLPGIVCIILGLKLGQTKKPTLETFADGDRFKRATSSDLRPSNSARADAFKFYANIGIGIGIPLMFLGSGITNRMEGGMFIGLPIFLGGFALEIWGCVNYMRWKGQSGWLGFAGYLLLPGLLILACLSNRRKAALTNSGPESQAALDELAAADRKPGAPYLLTITPVALLGLIIGGVAYSIGSNVDPAEWKTVDSKGLPFEAIMPGDARLVYEPKDTPAGKIEMHKFIVEPKGKKEMFMIISIRFPESVADEFGGPDKLLDLGRQDVLSATKGQVQSERAFVANGNSGLELEVRPATGAVVKAQIFATKTQIYEVWAHVPLVRLNSDDVQKFFDSFKLLDEAWRRK